MFGDARRFLCLMHGVAWASGPGDRSAARVIDVQETMDADLHDVLGDASDTVIDLNHSLMTEQRQNEVWPPVSG